MKRREFLGRGMIIGGGLLLIDKIPAAAKTALSEGKNSLGLGLYQLFREPALNCHPFVRWWWNGDKVEAGELVRELRLLKKAGIGGVEINPIKFPSRIQGDDLGKPSLLWLGKEWVNMLQITFDEAKRLGMTCDLIVGSGWPFGAEYLKGEERSQLVTVGIRKLTGPDEYEVSTYDLFKEADPSISSPYSGRKMELMSLLLVPDPLSDEQQIIDLSLQVEDEMVRFSVPEGKYVLYSLILVKGFMEVINGAPGANGPVLNHYNEKAISKYLTHMSEAIEGQSGPLKDHIRALFTDSMELEGANWTGDMAEEFKKRRGYDLLPFLPFLLYRIGNMGNVLDYNFGVDMSASVKNKVERIRYDFELTKAELIRDRFIKTYTEWCRGLHVKSRAQAYGRGFFPLEGTFEYDIPECESWTMTWLRHRLGEEMPDSDYRRGRAYTMINKYVSSAAHLKGKRLVSCEEMTDTYTVFNTSLEMLKIGGDQSAISGVSHSIFHGFNYSPPEAPYPGWIRYGAYYNEKNNWWPYFHYYNEYKARLSAALRNATMFADIAILPPLSDMWSTMGAQNEPFPSATNVPYVSLVWESIQKNGSGCDYVSEPVIRDSKIKGGWMCYGPRKYHTLFLVAVESLKPETAEKLYDFVKSGGRVFCIEKEPTKSLGWYNHEEMDRKVTNWIEKMKQYSDRFICLVKPETGFLDWYQNIRKRYAIRSYVEVESPDLYVMQNRYQTDDGAEMLLFINSHRYNTHETEIRFSKEIVTGRSGWIWDFETGERFRIELDSSRGFRLTLGPAESRLFVFDKEKTGKKWKPLPVSGSQLKGLKGSWDAEFRHCREPEVKKARLETLKDLKDIEEYAHFSGTVIYRKNIVVRDTESIVLNLGRTYGVSEVFVNGRSVGVRWYGNRIYRIGKYLKNGDNELEVRIVTEMGNYMKSLIDNPIARLWVNQKGREQPLNSMGMIGPVNLYREA